MNNNNSANTNCGVGFCGLLTLIFITLKLFGIISWSWIWVLSPIWIPSCILIVFMAVTLIISH